MRRDETIWDEIKGDETRQKLVIPHQGTSTGVISYRGLWWQHSGALLLQSCLQVISSWKSREPQKEDSGGPSSGDTFTESKCNTQYQVRPHASVTALLWRIIWSVCGSVVTKHEVLVCLEPLIKEQVAGLEGIRKTWIHSLTLTSL